MAYRIAMGDLVSNIVPYHAGLLEKPEPVMLAGLFYDTPWTRDASINTMSAGALLAPEVARHTLLSVLEWRDGQAYIGGQYWDAIIWVRGAWSLYLTSGDVDFLRLAFAATQNSLRYFEETEFDPEDGLFCGPACYGDGVAAYADVYALGPSSCILDWIKANHPQKRERGFGLPMKALSTNCLYYDAYHIATAMAGELQVEANAAWAEKAAALRSAINRHFWRAEAGSYRYLVDPFGGDERQEGFGLAFAILLGVADASQCEAIFQNHYSTAFGIPCLWPTYERYQTGDSSHIGRHSGCIWPQINAAWAEAAASRGKTGIFGGELKSLAALACRDGQFAEVYHPVTGAIYGGLQEEGADRVIQEYFACFRQTWCATGFLRMIYFGLLGLRLEPAGLRFEPCVPEGFEQIVLRGLPYRGGALDITVKGSGNKVADYHVNGVPHGIGEALKADAKEVTITMAHR